MNGMDRLKLFEFLAELTEFVEDDVRFWKKSLTLYNVQQQNDNKKEEILLEAMLDDYGSYKLIDPALPDRVVDAFVLDTVRRVYERSRSVLTSIVPILNRMNKGFLIND